MMRYDTPKLLRYENKAQERTNERKVEFKQTERLLGILAKKLGLSKSAPTKVA